MNVHQISEKFGISVTKLRALEKAKLLKVAKENELAAAIRFHLARKPTLSVAHILALMNDPDLIYELGNYEDKAYKVLAALGDVKAKAAAIEVTAFIRDAAKGDVEACEVLADWIVSVLPPRPYSVNHYWLASRLLIDVAPSLLPANIKAVGLAFLHVRELPSFAGYWTVDKKAVKYFMPQVSLAPHDL